VAHRSFCKKGAKLMERGIKGKKQEKGKGKGGQQKIG